LIAIALVTEAANAVKRLATAREEQFLPQKSQPLRLPFDHPPSSAKSPVQGSTTQHHLSPSVTRRSVSGMTAARAGYLCHPTT